jgi:hypothetical protein
MIQIIMTVFLRKNATMLHVERVDPFINVSHRYTLCLKVMQVTIVYRQQFANKLQRFHLFQSLRLFSVR